MDQDVSKLEHELRSWASDEFIKMILLIQMRAVCEDVTMGVNVQHVNNYFNNIKLPT